MDKDLLTHLKEISGLVALVASWGTLVMGGFCLLLYSEEIQQFPSGIGLGEGLAFYMICASFLLIYFIYWMAMTTLGMVLTRWPAQWLVSRGRQAAAKRGRDFGIPHAVPFHLMTSLETCLTSLIGVLLVVMNLLNESGNWVWLLGVALVQGILVGLWLVFRRKNDYASAGLLRLGAEEKKPTSSARDRRAPMLMIPALLLVMPLLIMPERMTFVSAAFSMAQLRKADATVHVRGAWNGILMESHLKARPSVLGKEYRRYDSVQVLLRSIGNITVLALPPVDTKKCQWNSGTSVVKCEFKPRIVSLPSTEVWVE